MADNNLSDRVGHHFNYALALKEQCAEQAIRFAALVKQGAPADVRSELSAEEAFSSGIHEGSLQNPYPADWGNLRSNYDFLISNDRFAKELESGLANRASPSDLVFLPNATPGQILGVALLLLKSPLYQTLRFVLILRYSIHAALGPIANRKLGLDKESADRYALCLEKLLSVDLAGSVRVATDSEELAKEYQTFSKRTIEVLPIPHTTHQAPQATSAAVPAKAPGKIRLIYLGDARDEKGFELLVGAVQAVTKAPCVSSVEFVFQAFISSVYHLAMQPAIDELARLKLANVHLIRSPLSSEGYNILLHSADVVLLPYDALTYRARTSGPFVEAICANKPVVVPNRSWMSVQLNGSRAGEAFTSGNTQDFARAVLTVVSNLPLHTGAAEDLGRRFREFHNPQSFIKRLMQIQ